MARKGSLDDAVAWLRQLLPGSWTISLVRPPNRAARIQITLPNGETVGLETTLLEDASPRAVGRFPPAPVPELVAARWISPRSRDLLSAAGISYVDSTGNAQISYDDPAIYVRTHGADRNPEPEPAPKPGLRGPKAWALLRTLAETPPPFGVRELAADVDVDPGYVSRVLRALEDELIVTRQPRGPVTEVDWEGAIRKAAETYSLFDSNDTSTWVATAGPDQFLNDLAKKLGVWAVTGSFAAARLAPVAAPETAVVYCEDPDRVARATRLLPATHGANVVLAQPFDPVVFEATAEIDGVTYASPAQVAIDSLTGNARMPAEGEAVLAWMRKNESRWRTREPIRSAS